MLVSDALRHLVSAGTGSPKAQLGPSAVFLAPASPLLVACSAEHASVDENAPTDRSQGSWEGFALVFKLQLKLRSALLQESWGTAQFYGAPVKSRDKGSRRTTGIR